MKLLIMMDSDPFTNTLNNVPDSSSDAVTKSLQSTTNFFGFHVSNSLLKLINEGINFLDFLIIIGILIGFTITVISLLGNNGQWKKRGVETAIWMYVALLITRLAPAIGLASEQIGFKNGISYTIILISQLLFYVGTPMLFLMGSHKLMLSEMTNNDQDLNYSKDYYRWVPRLMGIAASLFLITEVFI